MMPTEMDYEQKLAALNALTPCCLRMIEPGRWRVRTEDNMSIGGEKGPESTVAEGKTPLDAVEAMWAKVTNLAPGQYLVLNGDSPRKRKHYRWEGYIWKHLPHAPKRTQEPEAAGKGAKL